MDLLAKFRSCLKGTSEEKNRREEILAAILEAFEKEGQEGATSALKQRMKKLEEDFNHKLTQLEEKL